jgi:hypothetical protein
MVQMIEGGCLCGAIRYRVQGEPGAQAVCHCRNCQRQGGSAFSVLLGVRADILEIDGTPAVFVDHGESGRQVNRHFCRACGSPIYSELPASPAVVYLKAGTLDDVSVMNPKLHVWCASAWPWTVIPEGAIEIARNPG